MRFPLFWKLYGAYLALLVVVGLATGFWIQRTASANALDQQRRSLRFTAELVRDLSLPALSTPGGADQEQELASRISSLSRASHVRLTVMRADGRVIAGSEDDPARIDDHLDRPEIQEALRTGLGTAVRAGATPGRRTLHVAVPVVQAGQTVGIARAAISLSDLESELGELSWVLLSGALLAALFGLGAGLFFARRLSTSLDRMAHVAESIARGDYHAARPYGRSQELGRLAAALDVMAGNLRERMAAVESDRNKVLAILGSMVEGVIAVDKDERVVHMNEIAGHLLRLTPAAAVGRRIWEVTRVVEVCEILDAARRGGGEIQGEVRLSAERPGAGGRTLELRASPLRGASDETAGAVVVLHDVTDLRRLEAVRRDFVANVSHELKTPLTAIRGLVETLIDDPAMRALTRERFFEKIRDQSGRLSALVSDLLTLARIESQEAPPERRPLDLRGPLRDCAARFGPSCEKKGIALSLDLPDAPASVRADDESVRQILDNLTDNAVKYTPAGGRIWLAVRADGQARSSEVVLEVRDTGIGIEPRDQERVFERFYRVDKARSRELGGTGLGLSIVKHLALSLEGRVSVQSTPGHGSTFRIHLPALISSA